MLITNYQYDAILSYLDPDKVNLLLIAEHTPLDLEELIAYANKSNYEICGGIFPMIIYEDKNLDKGIILKTLSVSHKPILFKNLSKETFSIDLPALSFDTKSCLILIDGLMNCITDVLEDLYDNYWNQIGYIGAGCGSLSLQQQPCVFTNEGLEQNAFMMLHLKQEVGLGVSHGWEKLTGPFFANRTEGNLVYELNWRPALQVYKAILEESEGVIFTDDNFFDIAKGYPFGVYREGDEDVVRDPIRIGENEALEFLAEITQNVSLNLLSGKKEKLISSAAKATKDALSQVNKPSELFVVDCISRVLYLEEDFNEEVTAIKNALTSKKCGITIEGVLSLGEISSTKGRYLELYNKTVVVSAFE